MSYHPESEPGFSEDIECPRCHSTDIHWGELISEEFGNAAFFNVYKATCLDCEHEFKLIAVVNEEGYGVAEFDGHSYNKKPTRKRK